jgi:anti-anti-sigma factor
MSVFSERSTSTIAHCPLCSVVLAPGTRTPPFDAPCPECGYTLWCSKKTVGGVVILEVTPGITPQHEDIERLAETFVRSGGLTRVIVDLSDLELISSVFAARLVALNKRIRAARGRLILCGINRLVRETFQGCRMDRLFEISDDEGAALADL